MIASTIEPPYYAVIFTSIRTEYNDGYTEMAEEMEQLAALQAGFLGMEHAKEDVSITISYWKDLNSIKTWKANERHLIAQKTGRERWYRTYKTRICKVERDYGYISDLI